MAKRIDAPADDLREDAERANTFASNATAAPPTADRAKESTSELVRHIVRVA